MGPLLQLGKTLTKHFTVKNALCKLFADVACLEIKLLKLMTDW